MAHQCTEFACTQCHQPAMHLHRLPQELNKHLATQIKPVSLAIKQKVGRKITELDPNVPYRCTLRPEDLPEDLDFREEEIYAHFCEISVYYYIMQGEKNKFSFNLGMDDLWRCKGQKMGYFAQQIEKFTQEDSELMFDISAQEERTRFIIRKKGDEIRFTTCDAHASYFSAVKYGAIFVQIFRDMLRRLEVMEKLWDLTIDESLLKKDQKEGEKVK